MHESDPNRYRLKHNSSKQLNTLKSIFQVHHLNRKARGSYKNILPHI